MPTLTACGLDPRFIAESVPLTNNTGISISPRSIESKNADSMLVNKSTDSMYIGIEPPAKSEVDVMDVFPTGFPLAIWRVVQ